MGLLKLFTTKKELEIEIKKLHSILLIEKRKLQAEYDILATQKTYELTESMKIAKIEMEDKLNKQANLYNDALQKLHSKQVEEVAILKSDMAKEYYEKLSEAMKELNLEGSAQSKYVQELSMKMFDKALEKPSVPAHYITETRSS